MKCISCHKKTHGHHNRLGQRWGAKYVYEIHEMHVQFQLSSPKKYGDHTSNGVVMGVSIGVA